MKTERRNTGGKEEKNFGLTHSQCDVKEMPEKRTQSQQQNH